jgi:SAM-dependent methyltransferase
MNFLKKMFQTQNINEHSLNDVQQELVEDSSNNTNIEIEPNTSDLNYVSGGFKLYEQVRFTEFEFNTLEDLDNIDGYANSELRRLTYMDSVLEIGNTISNLIANGNKEISILDFGCGTGGMLVELNQYIEYLKSNNNNLEGIKIKYTLLDFNYSIIEYCKNTFEGVVNLELNYLDMDYQSLLLLKTEYYDVIICNRSFDYNLEIINPEYLKSNLLEIKTMDQYYKLLLNYLYAILNENGLLVITNQRFNDVEDYVYYCDPNLTINIFKDNAIIKSLINNLGIGLDTFFIKKLNKIWN